MESMIAQKTCALRYRRHAHHEDDGRVGDPSVDWEGMLVEKCKKRAGMNSHRYTLSVDGGQVSVFEEGD